MKKNVFLIFFLVSNALLSSPLKANGIDTTQNQCDLILLKNGKNIPAQNIFITNALLNYEVCQTAIVIKVQVPLDQVAGIRYKNGKNVIVKSEQARTIGTADQTYDSQKKLNGWALASTITSSLAWIALPVLSSILGILFGVFALTQIKKKSELLHQQK